MPTAPAEFKGVTLAIEVADDAEAKNACSRH
jgi:hypothetical protein